MAQTTTTKPTRPPYTILKKLGSGSFGSVFQVQRHRDGKILALKTIDISKMLPEMQQRANREVLLQSALAHQHIVKIDSYEYQNDGAILQIMMEVCEGGDLASHIKDQRKTSGLFSELTIWKFLGQLVSALHHCHEPSARTQGFSNCSILHRDLKPANIFMNGPKTELKLGDFGLARELQVDEHAHSWCGTKSYMAPQINTGSYDEKADIWSLGCILYELCTLQSLFDCAKQQDSLKAKIYDGIIPSIPSMYSQELRDILKRMLSVNEERRPTTTMLMKNHGVRWGIAETKLTANRKTIHSLQYKANLGGLATSTHVAELEAQIRTLKANLQEQRQPTKLRMSELDRRQQLLEGREAALIISTSRKEFKIKKAKETHERELEQLRKEFEAHQAAQMQILQDKEYQLNVREDALLAREAKHQKRRTSSTKETQTSRDFSNIPCRTVEERPMSNTVSDPISGASSAKAATRVVEDLVKINKRKNILKDITKIVQPLQVTPRKVKSVEELRKKITLHQPSEHKLHPTAHSTSIPVSVGDLFGPAEDDDVITVKPAANQMAAKPKRRLNRKAPIIFECAPDAEKVNIEPIKAMTRKVVSPMVPAAPLSPPARRYGLRSAITKK